MDSMNKNPKEQGREQENQYSKNGQNNMSQGKPNEEQTSGATYDTQSYGQVDSNNAEANNSRQNTLYHSPDSLHRESGQDSPQLNEQPASGNTEYRWSKPQGYVQAQGQEKIGAQQMPGQQDSPIPEGSTASKGPQQTAYCTWEPAQETGQNANYHVSQGAAEEAGKEQKRDQNHYYYAQTGNMPPMQPIGKQQKREKKAKAPFLTKRAAALLLVIGLLVGGGAGAGGALIATNMASRQEQSQEANDAEAQTVNAVSPSTSTVEQVVEKTANSVVEINTETLTEQMMGQYVSEGAGSGVIISKDGYIVTNNHVIEGAEKITVRLKNGNTYDAQLIGRDEKTDIAIIKIETEEELTVATLGESSSLKVGETAIAIGNPLGQLGGTVTTGIISALDREITLDGKQMNLLQTNAAINPGNSGGGLFDSEGNLIGIVVAKSSGSNVEGLGFAIPIDDVKMVIDELIDYGYVVGRTELGVTLVDIDTQQAAMMYRVNQMGTYILQVNEGSAAEKAGLQVGDRVLSFGEMPVNSSSDISSALDSYQAGDQVKMTVQRGEEKLDLTVTLEQKVS